jgi:hypothetical protein
VAIAEAEQPEAAANEEQMRMPQHRPQPLLMQPDAEPAVSVGQMRMPQHRPQPLLPTQQDVVALVVSEELAEEEANAEQQPYPRTGFRSRVSVTRAVPCLATCPSSPGRRN